MSRTKLSAAGSRVGGSYSGDGISQVMRGSAGGAYGITYLTGQEMGCFITEADVIISSEIVWETPDEQYANPRSSNPGGYYDLRRGYTTMVHEFGHVVGLYEANSYDFAVMQNFMSQDVQQTRKPLIGFTTDGLGRPFKIHVMPDDAKGYRFLYPRSGEARNVAASSARMNPDNGGYGVVSNQEPWDQATACRGAQVTTNKTLVNLGNVSQTIRDRLYISSSSTFHTQTGGVAVWQSSGFGYWLAAESITSVPDRTDLRANPPIVPR